MVWQEGSQVGVLGQRELCVHSSGYELMLTERPEAHTGVCVHWVTAIAAALSHISPNGGIHFILTSSALQSSSRLKSSVLSCGAPQLTVFILYSLSSHSFVKILSY